MDDGGIQVGVVGGVVVGGVVVGELEQGGSGVVGGVVGGVDGGFVGGVDGGVVVVPDGGVDGGVVGGVDGGVPGVEVVGSVDELVELLAGIDPVGLGMGMVTGGVGGGGTACGPGDTVAFGAPMGTLLSASGMTPERYASAHRITVFT